MVNGFLGSIGDQLTAWTVNQFPVLNNLHPWAFFGIMVLAAVILSQLVALIIDRGIKVFTKKTKTQADDIIIHAIHQPLAWLIFSILIYIAFSPLTFSEATHNFLNALLLTINIGVAAWLIHRLAGAFFKIWEEIISKKTASVLDDTMLPIISKFVKAMIWICAMLIVLSSWGIEIGPFLAGLGIAGIALGFAVKDSLANIFGGISLALDHAYRVGDKVKIGDTVGVVHDITLRSTRIRTYDGDLIMIPNGVVANANVYTYAQPMPKSRGVVHFGVEYGSDPEKVKKVVEKTLGAIEKIEPDPAPACWFISMGDSALEFRAYFWLKDYNDVWSTERAATKAIYQALRKSKVGIPFPTRTVYVKKQK